MTNKYKQYLKSKEWVNIKLDLFDTRGEKCEVCGSKYNLHIHHLTYENIFNENPEDLIILCAKCHTKEHGIFKRKKAKKRKSKIKHKPKTRVKVLTPSKEVELMRKNPKAYKKYVDNLIKHKDKIK